ncbi:MAG: MOSC domain-containing protein [Verrucomicrobiota bacterium]
MSPLGDPVYKKRMQVLHVNRSQPRTVVINGKDVSTGIYKEPVTEPVHVHSLGLEGDGQADLTVHGGIHQAVYAYPAEHYASWQDELSEPLFPPGTFGENLTLSGLLETDVRIGDVHRIGKLVLQVTSPRIPCFKLGHKLGRPGILKPFLQSGRSGFYYRVLEEGTVAAGSAVEVISRDPSGVTVRKLLGMHRLGEGDRGSIEKTLEIEALSPLVRKDLEARLAKM